MATQRTNRGLTRPTSVAASRFNRSAGPLRSLLHARLRRDTQGEVRAVESGTGRRSGSDAPAARARLPRRPHVRRAQRALLGLSSVSVYRVKCIELVGTSGGCTSGASDGHPVVFPGAVVEPTLAGRRLKRRRTRAGAGSSSIGSTRRAEAQRERKSMRCVSSPS